MIYSGMVPKILRINRYIHNVPNIIFKALEYEINNIIIESENFFRESKDMPRIGEGWIM